MNSHVDHPVYAGVAQLAGAYRTGELSPVEVVDAQLERIRRLDGVLHAYITVTGSTAHEQARAAERELRDGIDRGPLHGIPYAVKDQVLTKGIRTTSGSSILRDWVPRIDATVVARMHAAGAILLGKLNMPEFALGEPERYPYGIPRNPWNLDYQTGGSSSGSAAALAAGMTTVSIGEDTGGSIRQPAAHCGVVGLRPTWGLVSRFGVVPGVWPLDTLGPMARTVEDAAYLLGVLAGVDPLDSTTSDPSSHDYVSATAAKPNGLRAAVIRELLPGPGMDPEVGRAVEEAIRTLEQLGMIIGEVSVPLSLESWAIYGAYADPEAALTYTPYLLNCPERLDRNLRIRLAAGLLIPGAIARWGERVGRPAIAKQVLEALESFEILLAPTAHSAAPRIEQDGTQERFSADAIMHALIEDRAYRATFSLAGTPALAICCGFTSTGMPISLQIVGARMRDDLVLRVGRAYQQATNWHTRRPNLP